MGEFDIMINLNQILPKFNGNSLEWEEIKPYWRSNEETPILLDSICLTLKAIKIEVGSLTPTFKVVAEQFTHPIEMTISHDKTFEKTCPIADNLPFIKAEEMAAMADVDGGRFELTTSNLGKWADKIYEDPEFNEAGIPFSPFVVGYAKHIAVNLKEITLAVTEEKDDSMTVMNRTLTVRWEMSLKVRPIFGDKAVFLSNTVEQVNPVKGELEDWVDRVDEAVNLCACEVSTYAWSSVGGAVVPIPGTTVIADAAICVKMSSRFKTIFQETVNMDKIISDVREKFNYVPEEILVSNIRFCTVYMLEREAELLCEKFLHKLVLQQIGSHTLKTASHWLPFLGSIVASSLAYPCMRHTGFQLIDKYEKTYTEGLRELHSKLMNLPK